MTETGNPILPCLLDTALAAYRSGDSSNISDALRDLLIYFDHLLPANEENEDDR